MASHRADLERIDALTRRMEVRTDTPQGLMREHLLGLRTYLVGEMPDELRLQLDLVREAVPQLEESGLRSQVESLLRDLDARGPVSSR